MNDKRSKAILSIVSVLFLSGCVNKPIIRNDIIGDTWADARIITEQAAIIAEQRTTLENMGKSIDGILQDIRQSRITVEEIIGTISDLRELFGAIDIFVRAVIEAERQLEVLQRTD